MSRTSVVTVVLPSVPVMASTGRSSHQPARSNSERIGTPASAAAPKTRWRAGRPGAGTTPDRALHQEGQLVGARGLDQVAAQLGGQRAGGVAGAVVGQHHGLAVGDQGAGHGRAGHAQADDQVGRAQSSVPVETKSA